MPRDDFDRRRLRALYDRNRRRVSALADARDRRRGGEDDFAAPRRYVVSERRTRIEGFGRGGTQVRRVVRRARAGRTDEPRPRRFSDRAIFRRSGRDRFRRAEDFDREDRRDRFREKRLRRIDGRQAETRRFGEARRMRLRMRGTRAGVERRRPRENRGGDDRRRQQGGRQGNGNSQVALGGKKQVNQVHNKQQQNKQQQNKQQQNKQQQNKQQQNKQQHNNKQQNNSNQQRGNSQQHANKKPQRIREPQLTREELDRQLDNYRN
ncbi:hypothetical protein JKF63_02773 [Porcisia hertigi]|uniref:Chromatin target of PRMT1 protein C-terminal domain-containing protein n=1 Tax=Porcisia hertigi TaxID=2761500 RepID=A0A836L624_9TRYP|nr:hypothetical protein JKF63_02773 [Porcisia hertigi]